MSLAPGVSLQGGQSESSCLQKGVIGACTEYGGNTKSEKTKTCKSAKDSERR